MVGRPRSQVNESRRRVGCGGHLFAGAPRLSGVIGVAQFVLGILVIGRWTRLNFPPPQKRSRRDSWIERGPASWIATPKRAFGSSGGPKDPNWLSKPLKLVWLKRLKKSTCHCSFIFSV